MGIVHWSLLFSSIVVGCTCFRTGYSFLSKTSDLVSQHNSCKTSLCMGMKKMKSLSPLYKPNTENQKKYVEFLQNDAKSLIVVLGPAGSGKTLFACMNAIMALKRGDVRKIVITRPLVSVEEEEIGFLPGNLISKMDPWTKPMIDIFSEFYTPSDITNFIKQGVLEVAPLAFMRGRTFHQTFVIADEMQNSSPSQMMMLTTRIGSGSKMVVTGDLAQSDRSLSNGLKDFLEKFEIHKKRVGESVALRDIGLVQMNAHDVQRSSLVSHVLQIYEGHNIPTFDDPVNMNTFNTFNDPTIKNFIPLRDQGRPYK
jgi:phosphate starvation-inducible PhoH-like protein